jgi:hypothetical protein
MTTSVRWSVEETKRTLLLVFSGLTALNVGNRLIKERRVSPGEALAGLGSLLLLWREFARKAVPEAAPADEPPANEAVPV